ncbi:hypothetical protein LFM09_09035 [Lentzea alba]|uniref:hypothetical protein n=1 Tax=Lentzea alba TaxID=2714351 RepID=UPI0039BF7B36
MYAQLTYFDRPRGPELLAAEDFAAEARIKPAAASVPGNISTYVLRRADGTEVVVSIAETEQALIDTGKAIMSTGLLPDEDPALLPGPDRVEIYPVHVYYEHPGARS